MKQKKFLTANGLEIAVLNNNSQNIQLCLTVKVGHNNETDQNLGISALFEKLLLTRADNQVQAVYGGTITSYYIEVTKENLLSGLDTLANLFQNFSFSEKEIAEQKQDIIQRTIDTFVIPRRQLKLLYKHTAYRNAHVNWDHDHYISSVGGFSANDLETFANRYYVTKNMILVANGNVDEAWLFAKAEKLFAHLPQGKRNHISKDIYTGGFAIIPALQQTMNMVYVGFDVGNVSSNPALSVLIKMLFGRLERSLVDTDVITDVKLAGYYGRRSLQISLKTHMEDLNEILQIICANINRLCNEEASPRRLSTSKSLATEDYLNLFGSTLGVSEISWQIIGVGQMYDTSGLISEITKISQQDIIDTARSIFATKMTLVASTSQEINYEQICAAIQCK